MIDKLSIKNFKSIKEISIDCKRINLFIGEPNTGKSNILEALGLMSWVDQYSISDLPKLQLDAYLRFKNLQDLFFCHLLNENIELDCYYPLRQVFTLRLHQNQIWLSRYPKNVTNESLCEFEIHSDLSENFLRSSPSYSPSMESLNIKYYNVTNYLHYPGLNPHCSSLLPPDGRNLFHLMNANKSIRDAIANIFIGLDLRLMLKSQGKRFQILKQLDELSISFPYSAISESLQNSIYFTAAMVSNKNSSLVFDNPLTSVFPGDAKHFGDCIAFDDSNQYFIATHNPYLLYAIMEKAKIVDLNICITYLENRQTNIRLLKEEEIPLFLDSDPFFNLGLFLEK